MTTRGFLNRSWPWSNGRASSASEGLVEVANGLDSLWTFNQVLECLVRNLGAFGCVFWRAETSPDNPDPPETFEDGHLFALDFWFRDDAVTVTDPEVTVRDRAEGEAVLAKKTIIVDRGRSNFRPDTVISLQDRATVQSMVCVPSGFVKGSRCVLSIYFGPDNPVSSKDLPGIEQAVQLIVLLYQVTRATTESGIVGAITATLRADEANTDVTRDPKAVRKAALDEVAKLLSEGLQCVQTSIYLRDLDVDDVLTPAEPVYSLVASTAAINVSFDTDKIRISEKRLSAWVARTKSPLRLFNLEYLDASRRRDPVAKPEARWKRVQQQYPGLEWQGERGIVEACRTAARELSFPDIRYVSYVAVPIIVGTDCIGIIRCLATYRPSNVFAKWDIDALQAVSTIVGGYVTSERTRRVVQEDIALLRRLVAGVNELSKIVIEEVGQSDHEPNAGRIHAHGLQVIRELLGADSSNIRRYNPDEYELRYFATGGEAWPGNQTANLETFQTKRWSLRPGDGETSAGRHVFETQEVHVARLPNKDRPDDPTFDHVQWAIVAPISAGDRLFGVLDVRCTTSVPLPRLGHVVAELLSRQLGLYHQLADAVRDLRRAQVRLEQSSLRQRRAYLDLKHQLGSPLGQADLRITKLVQSLPAESRVERSLRSIRGIIGKTARVAQNVNLFVEIHEPGGISCKFDGSFHEYIDGLIGRAASDNENGGEQEQYRDIRISVNHESLQGLKRGEIRADRALVEQAVDCLLDNATKYSYGSEVVQVFGKRIGTSAFRIVVRNRGIPISDEEVERCKEYGYRSDHATWTTGQGNGIGLWIVDHIMMAHGGKLIVAPSTPDHYTEVSLEFPVRS